MDHWGDLQDQSPSLRGKLRLGPSWFCPRNHAWLTGQEQVEGPVAGPKDTEQRAESISALRQSL